MEGSVCGMISSKLLSRYLSEENHENPVSVDSHRAEV
jgi:hypothetical protein